MDEVALSPSSRIIASLAITALRGENSWWNWKKACNVNSSAKSALSTHDERYMWMFIYTCFKIDVRKEIIELTRLNIKLYQNLAIDNFEKTSVFNITSSAFARRIVILLVCLVLLKMSYLPFSESICRVSRETTRTCTDSQPLSYQKKTSFANLNCKTEFTMTRKINFV